MKRSWGLMLGVLLAGACGTAQTTGTAQNNWDTPTGYASATNQRYYNPDAAAHPARDRSVFAKREAPPLQEAPPATDETPPPPLRNPISPDTVPAPETVPPGAAPETMPPPGAIPPGHL